MCPKAYCVSIDLFNVLESAIEEFKDLQNPRLTLEVSFYGEHAYDAGGPRKEFFRLCLKEIQQRLFENWTARTHGPRNMSLLELLWP